jgi:predicted Rossmann fold flavoprotein
MEIRTLILGAGAAGMFCATRAGPGTLVVDHAGAPGEKIRISGGGRCNFTNTGCGAANFLSENPHFAKSALSRYTPWDFVALVERHGIGWHEKTLGQLFCDGKATQIVDMLGSEMAKSGADLWLKTEVVSVDRTEAGFVVRLMRDGVPKTLRAQSLVVATGGKSIPKMGATGLAYQIAAQFGLRVTQTRPALVPFTFSDERFKPLAGVALPVRATADGPAFDEAMLFTHRGLSGPAVLQASSYWTEGAAVTIDLAPSSDLATLLRAARADTPRKNLTTVLAQHLPARLVDYLAGVFDLSGNCAEWSDARIDALTQNLSHWSLRPTATEGYRTAEVTLGGVATDGLSSKTMEAKAVPGLYFIGECVDVTGWLGGYNFQWAWASGHAAGAAISEKEAL